MAWFRRQNPQPRSVTPPLQPESVFDPVQTPYIPPPMTLLNAGADEETSGLGDLLQTVEYARAPAPLTVGLGTATNTPCILDLALAEHVLVAGAPPVIRDSMVHTILLNLIFRNSPDILRMVLLEGDTTAAALPIYNPIPHLVSPVIIEPTKMLGALRWMVQELERRRRLYRDAGANDIGTYNEIGTEHLPFILVILNEFVPVIRKIDLSDFIESVSTILQNGAQYGIHLIVTTQLPETTTLSDLFPAPLKHRMPTKVLWAGSWMTNSGEQPWLLQSAFDRQTRAVNGVWVSPRDATRVADYFAPAGTVTTGTLVELDSLSGVEFEEAMQAILRDRGWQLDLTAITGDFGADLIGRGPDGATWVIQAKRWKGSVGIEAVQQVLGAQAYYQSQKALLVTTAPLTKAAIELAERTHVTVWTRADVIPMFTALRERSILVHRLYPSHPSGSKTAAPEFAPDGPEVADPLFWDAVRIVAEGGQASTSLLQRRMRIGYTRAAQLIDTMESRGYVGPAEGSRSREVFITPDELRQLDTNTFDA